jgi:hypothetical protein
MYCSSTGEKMSARCLAGIVSGLLGFGLFVLACNSNDKISWPLATLIIFLSSLGVHLLYTTLRVILPPIPEQPIPEQPTIQVIGLREGLVCPQCRSDAQFLFKNHGWCPECFETFSIRPIQ